MPHIYVHMQLDKWQEEVLNHDGHLLLCTGRQVGKTTIFARKAAEYMLKHYGSRIIVVSLTEDQAQLMIVMILTFLEKNHKKEIQKGKYKPTKSTITLRNKSRVIARPVGNTGDAVRGFTGDVLIVDEAAGMPEMMWAGAKPTLASTGGQIWMCSTPRGKQGYFYDCYLNKQNRYKIVEVNTLQVYRERPISEDWTPQRKKLAIQFVEEEREQMSALQFGQEFEGKFLEDLQQFFPDELIRRRQVTKRRDRTEPNRDYYLGCDIARMGDDETTYEIVERTPSDHLIHLDNQVTKKTILTDTARHIFSLNQQYDFRKIYVDSEGIGIGVFDMLISDPRTKRKVEGLKNSQKVIDYKKDKKQKLLKEDLYLNLLRVMEQDKIDLLDDPDVFTSLKSVQYEFINDKKGHPFMRIFGNYTHIVEGIIRAAWCVKQKNIKLSIHYV